MSSRYYHSTRLEFSQSKSFAVLSKSSWPFTWSMTHIYCCDTDPLKKTIQRKFETSETQINIIASTVFKCTKTVSARLILWHLYYDISTSGNSWWKSSTKNSIITFQLSLFTFRGKCPRWEVNKENKTAADMVESTTTLKNILNSENYRGQRREHI